MRFVPWRVHYIVLLLSLVFTGAFCGGVSPGRFHRQEKNTGDDSWLHDFTVPHLKDFAAKHGIFVGTASNAGHIQGEDKEYDAVLADQFSLTTPENACKWGSIRPSESTYDYKDCDLVVSTAESNNQTVRGHNLCWGVYNPGWLNKFAHNGTALRKLLTDHVTNVTEHYMNRMYSWDVVNEAVSDNPSKESFLKNNIWYPAVKDYIDAAFKAASAADSQVKLFYNDYNTASINPKSDAIYQMLKTMLENKVPLHGFGIQAHFSLSGFKDIDKQEQGIYGYKLSAPPSDWSKVEDNIKRFVDLGLEIHITELDVRINSDSKEDLKNQADVYQNMLKACLKFAPKCKSFETWGFVDKYSWLATHHPDYFDNNYKPKPCFYAVLDTLNTTQTDEL
ncbi:endo-1,4-beta-xylanase Z-like [Sycon ciliatum]|uniref:endo-1,4-beta-xylanase Z-like n=1 Tax=Sycon ciliatum TaxID=27933 RepID=UPI0031F70340